MISHYMTDEDIINILKHLNPQVSLSTYTRSIDILSNTRILGLACYPLFVNICVCKYNNNHYLIMDVGKLSLYVFNLLVCTRHRNSSINASAFSLQILVAEQSCFGLM